MTPTLTGPGNLNTGSLIAPLENVTRAPRVPRGLIGAGLSLAALSAWAFDGGPLGLGFVVVSLALVVALAVVGGREAWQSARGHRLLLLAALVLASFVAVRDSELLVALDVLAAAFLLSLAVRGWNGERPLTDSSLGDLALGPFSTLGGGAWLGASLSADTLRESRLADSAQRYAGPFARVVLIAGPVVGLVTLLLAMGDASFRTRLGRLFDDAGSLPMETLVRSAMVALFTLPMVVGLIAWALRRRTNQVLATKEPLVRLGAAESFALVGGLMAVTVLFGAVSAECALAPDACVLPAGMTYAQYAHEGFYELVIAAGIVLAVLLSVPGRAKLDSKGLQSGLRWLATGLVAATLPMLVSAFARMMLYEDVYGFTRQRVLSQAICVLIGMLLAWRAATLWTWPSRFAVGAVASGVLCLLGLNALDPDAFIARRNLSPSRYAALSASEPTVAVDAWYLGTLSADATPELVAFVNSEAPAEVRASVARAALESRSPAPLSIASFNLARWHERRLLAR